MCHRKEGKAPGINRRELLRKAGLAALVPLGLLVADSASAQGARPLAASALPGGLVKVFRLRTCPPGELERRACSCNACRQHARYKYFASAAAADAHRAHVGCNCSIAAELIPSQQFIAMFRPNTRFARVVFDLRWK